MKRKVLFYFSITCIILAIVLMGISHIVHDQVLQLKPSRFVYFLFAWFPSLSILNFYLIEQSLVRKPAGFVNTFYITVFMRMILSLGILLVYLFLFKHQPVSAISVFGGLYLAFFLTEISFLMKIVRAKKGS